jgi:hypothetical protein
MIPDLSPFADKRELPARSRSARVFRLLPILAGLAVPAALVLLTPGCGRGKPEVRHKGALPYAVLDKAFQPLRRDFEDADGKVRLVGIVAPTCGECIEDAAAIDQRLLPAIPGDDFEVFLVWACTIPPDVEVNARKMAERYADPRIRHYWDGSGRIARAFGRHAGLPDGAPAYGLFYLYGRADTWDAEGRMGTEPAGYNAVLDGWEPAQPRARAGKHPRLKLPQFIVETLRSQIEHLLAEPDAAAGAGGR